MSAPSFPTFSTGLLAFERYRLVRELGRGGMGVVWLARDTHLDREVALKFLPEAIAQDADAVAQLKRETRRALSLTHPHILRIHDFAQNGPLCAVVMEYAPGPSLAEMRRARPGGFFEPDEILPWITQLCSALDHAHAKARVIHRDLKPSNILTDAQGRAKIADFGISASLSETLTRLTHQSGSSGTPTYMSPQQMLGARPSPADDIYALGATLHELLASCPPFSGPDLIRQVQQSAPIPINIRRAESSVSAKPIRHFWESAIAACLAKEPEDRPASAGDVLLALKGASFRSGPPTADARPVSRAWPAILAGSATIVVLAAAAAWRFTNSAARPPEPIRAETAPAQTTEPPSPEPVFSPLTVGKVHRLPGLSIQFIPVRSGAVNVPPSTGAYPDGTIHIHESFWLGKHEVTQADWLAVMGDSVLSEMVGARSDDSRPVHRASFRDALAFCRALTEYESAAGRLPEGHVFTLPTEIQWFHACLADAGAPLPRTPEFDAVGWHAGNSPSLTDLFRKLGREPTTEELRSPQPVGTKTPNAWGFHDMLGNVQEWCFPAFHPHPYSNLNDIKALPAVARGGDFLSATDRLQPVSNQFVSDLGARGEARGFRVALVRSDASLDHIEAGLLIHPLTDYLARLKTGRYLPWQVPIAAADPNVKIAEDRMREFPSPVSDAVRSTPFYEQAYQARIDAVERLVRLWTKDYTARFPGALASDYVEFSRLHDLSASPDLPASHLARIERTVEITAPSFGIEFTNTLSQDFIPVEGLSVAFARVKTPLKAYNIFANETGRPPSPIPDFGYAQAPATAVSWSDAHAFCDWLTAREQTTGRIGPDQRYRIPTDAEWSWLAGLPAETGTSPAENARNAPLHFPFTNRSTDMNEGRLNAQVGRLLRISAPVRLPAWWHGNYGLHLEDGHAGIAPLPHLLARRALNSDQAPDDWASLNNPGGNLWEWCEDLHDPSLPNQRVLRGGSYRSIATPELLSAARRPLNEDAREADVGFRCVFEYAPAAMTLPLVEKKRQALQTERERFFAELADQQSAEPPQTPDPRKLFTNSLGMTFMIARSTITNGNRTRIRHGAGVMLARHETTSGAFARFAAETGLAWRQEGPSDLPAAHVSYADAEAFCEWLTKTETQARRLLPGQHYRLPTTAEWSIAVWHWEDVVDPFFSAHTYPWISKWPPSPEAGNYGRTGTPREPADPFPSLAPVGSFRSWNGYHDLGGNVWEWTSTDQDNGLGKILRGGSYLTANEADALSSARRASALDNPGGLDIGFRCVLVP